MIDPIDSLAFSIHANPGIYAVLVGSGISRSAKIPTGWDITLELVRKLAVITGEDCGDDPEGWYRTKFSKEPDYSELLDGLAKTPAARQQLLKTYWEPTPEEREEGAKSPTAAHRAIANLVQKGFIRVIVTTNFDRLLETALADVGITPTVLSTADEIHGALPLIHTNCTIVKVHGDYLDTRIKNTPDELSTYTPEFNTVLDRIFDEFGLIVCGWSADWDVALRAAITRAPSRRYAMYWAARGVPGTVAQELIAHRQAIQLPITGADQFFSTVTQKVESLEEFLRPHPLSTEMAVASLKRFMSEHKFRIQHEDLILSEVERVEQNIGQEKFPTHGRLPIDTQSLTQRVRAYEGHMASLTAMAVQAGYWAEPQHYPSWTKTIARLSTVHRQSGGTVTLLDFQKYPASLLLYCLGIAAVEAGKLDFLRELCETAIAREHHEDKIAVQLLPSGCLLEYSDDAKNLEGMGRIYAPLANWIYQTCRPLFNRLIPNDTHFMYVFDKLEILLALSFGKNSDRDPSWHWIPPGPFGYRHSNRTKILGEIENSLANKKETSPFVTASLFGETEEACRKQIELFKTFVQKLNWH